MLWMCNNKTEEKWIVSFCSCSLRYHISTFPDDKKSLWDHQCLLPHRHSSGWGCERQWATEKGAEVLWCCLSFISHCSNFLWMNIWWSLRLEVGGLNSGFWLIPLVSPAIVVCTVESNVEGPFVTTNWLLMWCGHWHLARIWLSGVFSVLRQLVHFTNVAPCFKGKEVQCYRNTSYKQMRNPRFCTWNECCTQSCRCT